MSQKKLYSLPLEQQLLAGLLQFPHKFHEVTQFLSQDDFGDPARVNPTIFRIIGIIISEGGTPDHVLVAKRLSDLGIKFDGDFNTFDYLQSLKMRQVSEGGIDGVAKAIKKMSIRRDIITSSRKIEKAMTELDDSVSFDEIVSTADSIYNTQLDPYFNESRKPQNIFENMEEIVELRAQNPITEIGPMIPDFPRVNGMLGSLFRAGNITVLASRFGVGKTTLALDLASKVAASYNLPILHCDNNEMSMEELQFRMAAWLSDVPLHMIENGSWRKNKDTERKVREAWKKTKNYKLFYYNVGNLHYSEITNLVRRWYHSNVGRGNKMIWSFDYIKLISVDGEKDFWIGITKMLDSFKSLIQREIVYENKPQISQLSSVQLNRKGVSRGKNSVDVNDTEESIGLSDGIGQICSHLLLLRKKTLDEMIVDGQNWGTHKLIPMKYRHLGEDRRRLQDPIKMPDGKLRDNFINLEIDNFKVKEKGDLLDICNSLDVHKMLPPQD